MDREDTNIDEQQKNGIEDQETSESLAALIKQAAELSRIGAMVSFAFARAKSVEQAKAIHEDLSGKLDSGIKATVGAIKENSKLYDEIQSKKAAICEHYDEVLDSVTQFYDEKIGELLAEQAELENENLSLAADNHNLSYDKQNMEKAYRRDQKQQNNSELSNLIADKKKEAEQLAMDGDMEGAQAVLAEYEKLNQTLVRGTTGGVIEIAKISQQINENAERYEQNEDRLQDISEEIRRLEQEKEDVLDRACTIEDKELAEVDNNSIFKKIAMFASKTVTRVFNKGKAINDNVFKPMKKKIETQLPVIEDNIGTTISSIKTKVTESFKSNLNKAIELGKSFKDGAIEKLTDIVKSANDKMSEKIENMNEYLESRD